MIKYFIGLTAIHIPEQWLDTGKWKVFFYYRRWPWHHNDNYKF